MTTDIARLVDELRAASNEGGLGSGTFSPLLTRAASALEAQARELAEAWEIANAQGQQRMANLLRAEAAEARIAALEDAVRVKDEALEPFAKAAEPVMHDAKGRWDPDSWFKLLGKLTVGDYRRAHRARTALAGREGGE